MKFNSLQFLKPTLGFRISIASPLTIIKWSWRKINKNVISGQVTEPYTINFRGGNPILHGLFCEKIFGPIISWQCKCNFFSNSDPIKYVCICPLCGFENNNNIIRRYRMAYIYLKSPVLHIWYLDNFISYILKLTKNNIEYLIYYKFINIRKNLKTNQKKDDFTISQLIFASDYIQFLLKQLNPLNEILKIKTFLLNKIKNEKKKDYNKTLNILNLCLINNLQLHWILLDIIPVLPAGLRTLTKLNTSNFVSSPLNELYKLIIIKNNRLKRLQNLRNNFPLFFEIIEKRNLQKTIDKLLQYNLKKEISYLSSHYQGKYNYFRQYILGKRIDFSGRSVIVSGPTIPFNKIGLSTLMSIQLYKPLVTNILKNNYFVNTLLKASYFTENTLLIIQRILKYIFRKQIIIVNRAPTLHRINVQTFKPFLIENETIKLYPLACSGFNADFDGDQMGIFLILSKYSKKEAKRNMVFDKNLFAPSSERNIFKITQNSVLGLNTLLFLKANKTKNLFFSNVEDILNAYDHSLLNLNTLCCLRIKYNHFFSDILKKKYLITSLSKLLLPNLR